MTRAAGYLIPAAACLILYWPGLMAWFAQDDFAWLGLRLSIHSWPDFWNALFAPKAQGTIRPLSERLFFLAGERVFGLEALGFRIVVFATQLGNLWLLNRLVERWTGSPWAGMWTALFWVANSALAQSMSWTSAFNQVLWPCFLLAALHCRTRWIEDGSSRARFGEWGLFLLGFGALELNVVYPAIALAVTFVLRRSRWTDTAPMFAVSAAYTLAHRLMARPAGGSIYQLHLDGSVFGTLGYYFRMATGIWRAEFRPEWSVWLDAAEWVAAAGLAAAILSIAFRRNQWVAVGIVWFVAALAPVLPLRDHITDYYLTVPVIGLAMIAGIATAQRPLWALLPACVYLAGSAAVARQTVEYNYDRSQLARTLVMGVKQASANHPGKILLLTGVSSDQYWAGVNDNPFRLLPGVEAYLAPGAEDNIDKHPELGDPARFILPAPAAVKAVETGQALVYSTAGPRLRNVTVIWKGIAAQRWKGELADVVDVGQPLLADQLLEGWYAIEEGFRWMADRGRIRLAPPGSAKEVYLRAFRSPDETARGTITLRIYINGQQAGEATLAAGQGSLEASAKLPSGLDRNSSLEVEFRIDPPLVEPGDGGRRLGLAFGVVGLR